MKKSTLFYSFLKQLLFFQWSNHLFEQSSFCCLRASTADLNTVTLNEREREKGKLSCLVSFGFSTLTIHRQVDELLQKFIKRSETKGPKAFRQARGQFINWLPLFLKGGCMNKFQWVLSNWHDQVRQQHVKRRAFSFWLQGSVYFLH